MDIKILVSSHKPYKMPEDASLYLPVQVGCDDVTERFGNQCDNTGDNISYKLDGILISVPFIGDGRI